MSIYNLGRVLPIFRGEFDENENYNNLDVVLYQGSSYVANHTVTNVLPTNDEYWTLVAQAGTLSPDQIASIEQQVIDYVQSQGYVIDANYVHTDNNYTNEDKTKLTGINMSTKQDTLVSGSNIKTINNESILGSGNITIEGGTGTTDYTDLTNKPSINNVTLTGNKTTAQLGINIPTKTSDLTNDSNFVNTTQLNTAVGNKQDTLVSGTNIKTVNNQSLLGSGNITISGGGGGTTDYDDLTDKPSINNVTLSGNKTTSDLGLQEPLVSGTNIKTVNNQSLLGSGNITIEGGNEGYEVNKSNFPKLVFNITGFYRPAGTSSTSSGYKRTDVIPVNKIKKITLTIAVGSASVSPCVFFNSEGTYISGSGVSPVAVDGSYTTPYTYEIDVPNDAFFAIFSVRETSLSTVSISSLMDFENSILNDVCYLSVSGNDANDGLTQATPVKSISVAMNLTEKTLYITEGIYWNLPIENLSNFKEIIGIGNPILKYYNFKIDSAELVEGTTKTYKKENINNPYNLYLWQDGIESMPILDSERHPINNGKTNRLPSTRIYMASSLSELEEDNGKLMYFWDSTSNTLYFNKINNSDLSINPIIIPKGGSATALQNTNPEKVYVENIKVYYRGVRISNGEGEFKNCSAGMVNADGAFSNLNSNVYYYSCEGYATYSESGGDGFNTHCNNNKTSTILLYNCWGHDNRDDGESAHENTNVVQFGGLYEYNGSGCTPASLASAEYNNVICRHNNNHDWVYNESRANFSNQGGKCMICINCISIDSTYGFYQSGTGNNSICYGCYTKDCTINFGANVNNYGSVNITE